MNGHTRELSTFCRLRNDVLPPIKFKQYSSPMHQPYHSQHIDMSGVLVCQAHRQIPGRLRPLNHPAMPQSISDTDGINNNTSEVSFDLHCPDTECDETLPEHERPKAPEPMILESISNCDFSELMNKEDSPTELVHSTPEVRANKIHQVTTNQTTRMKNSTMDCLVVEDIDDVDYDDFSDGAMRSSGMMIMQTLSQEPLIGSDSGENSRAKEVSCKSISSNKKSHSKLRRFTSSITRAVTNKFRKLRRPSREVVPSNGSKVANESDDSIATSTRNPLQRSLS